MRWRTNTNPSFVWESSPRAISFPPSGLIYTLPKKGVYVARLDTAEQKEATEENTLTNEARSALLSLKDSGLTREALEALITEVYGK